MFSQSGTKFDPITKIWSGPRKKQFYSSEMTLGEVILGSLSLNKKKVIQVCDTTGQSLTAGELLEQSKAVAAHLIRMGLKPGDVVGIAAANTTNLTAIVIGAFLIGTPTHCVYPDFDMDIFVVRREFAVKMDSHAETYFDSEKRIWSGPKRKPFYSSEITLGDLFLHNLSMNPNKIVQVFDPTGESLTGAELLKQSKAVAVNFIKLGLQPGDVVGIAASNTPNLTAVVVGIFLSGALPHAVFPEFDKESIKTIYDVSKPKIIFCDVENYEVVKQVAQELLLDSRIFVVNGQIPNVESACELFKCDKQSMITSFPCSKLHGNSVAMIMCSSGTSGPPKGVLSTHTALINQSSYFNMINESVFFVFSTLYWISGMMSLVESLKNGLKRVITDKPFTPQYFVELVEKHKITHTLINPSQCAQIVKEIDSRSRERLSSLYLVFCGGSKVPETLVPKFDDILGYGDKPGLTVGYGMTEAGGVLVINDEGPGKRKLFTEGRLAPNVQMRIVDETGNNLGINEKGMIYFKLPFEWPGYLKNPKATNDTLQDGWIKSGDLGYFDQDGYLTICARDSEIFKSAGFQVFPPQIEEVIMKLDGVLEVCVFGIPHDTLGNLIACAVVVTNDENGKNLTKLDIENHVKENMAKIYNLTGGVYFMESFPHSGSGKIIRRMIPVLILNTK